MERGKVLIILSIAQRTGSVKEWGRAAGRTNTITQFQCGDGARFNVFKWDFNHFVDHAVVVGGVLRRLLQARILGNVGCEGAERSGKRSGLEGSRGLDESSDLISSVTFRREELGVRLLESTEAESDFLSLSREDFLSLAAGPPSRHCLVVFWKTSLGTSLMRLLPHRFPLPPQGSP